MKKKILNISIILAILLTIFAAINFIRPSALEDNGYYVTTTNLNVRTGPGTEYRKIGVLVEGTVVVPLNEQNGWYEINFGSVNGFISADYVTYIEPVVEQPTTSPAQDAVVASVPTPQPSVIDDGDREYAMSIFNRVNEYRTSIGVQQLVWDENLYNVANVRAHEIYTLWSHTRPNGQNPSSCFKEFGISYNYAGENLLKQGTSVENCFAGWYASDGHRKAMENGNFTKSAVFVYWGPDGQIYVAQEFTD